MCVVDRAFRSDHHVEPPTFPRFVSSPLFYSFLSPDCLLPKLCRSVACAQASTFMITARAFVCTADGYTLLSSHWPRRQFGLPHTPCVRAQASTVHIYRPQSETDVKNKDYERSCMVDRAFRNDHCIGSSTLPRCIYSLSLLLSFA